jgi:CheY-like chemotaxis protein
VVEDNLVNQKLIVAMLTKWGYHIHVANNGKEAVDMIESSPESFDLILMDIQMPVMDGLTATAVIRSKGFTEIPIIAMTAHTLDNDREKCLKAGMNDYTAKPIKRDFVFKLIEKWVLSDSSHGE